ncbi:MULTISPECIES: hypothetical protein [Haloferax]|uniref:Uncharacterized protein n=2 Tax=Haloferax TaxID=2251 RepID=A0A6G1YZ30_9EURY|nr:MULTISPECIES: hypothetical protein [Haloferax]KAB1186683.1 hypothetical protein Hfx1149_01005 [Haloferax sp. CBA1149]MRW79304.1 hypothetical protein [Haloferax marinisediminis]
MVVAAAILSSLSVVLALFVAVLGAFAGFAVLGLLTTPFEFAYGLPRLFAVLSLSPDGYEWPFRTHPPTAERIARLQRLAAEQEQR